MIFYMVFLSQNFLSYSNFFVQESCFFCASVFFRSEIQFKNYFTLSKRDCSTVATILFLYNFFQTLVLVAYFSVSDSSFTSCCCSYE